MRPRHMLAVVAALAAAVVAVVAAGSVGPAGAQTGDPVVFDVTPATQTTAPGTQVDFTFTVSDVPPCDDGNIVTLDSLDFTVTDPSGMSTIASWSYSEPPGSVAESLSPDATSLSLLFADGFPCENPLGPSPGTTETISVVVTLDVPAGVASGTQLTLTGDARGFVEPPGTDYLLQRTATVLVQSPPPVVFSVTPPSQTTAPGTTVDVTSTVSDFPPCGSDDTTTLDSFDFELSDPSGLSTIDSVTTDEEDVSVNHSPDGTALTLLFGDAFPCLNGTTESITVVVTLNVPAGVPSGTQLTLTGDARGFASPGEGNYLLQRTATVLVEDPPPPPPPDPGDGPGDGAGDGSTPSGGAAPGAGAGTVPGVTPAAATATSVTATARFTG